MADPAHIADHVRRAISQRLFTGGLGPLDHVGTVNILSPIN